MYKKNSQLVGFLIGLSIAIILGFFAFQSLPVFAEATNTLGIDEIDTNIALGSSDIRVTIVKIINVLLGLLGIVALGIVLYAGFLWMTAGGSEEKIATAKKLLINGMIGLIIIMSSWAITKFVLNKLGEATGINTTTNEQCNDPIYAANNPQQCDPKFPICVENPTLPGCNDCTEYTPDFVAKSITPVTDDTGMNNVAIRVLFNKPIHEDFTSSTTGIESIIYQIQYNDGNTTTSVKDDFTFDIVPFYATSTIKNQMKEMYYGVEARPTSTNFICEKTGEPCLKKGTYTVLVNPTLRAENGKEITKTAESCDIDYPLDASFTVKTEITPSVQITDTEGALFHVSLDNEDSLNDSIGGIIADTTQNSTDFFATGVVNQGKYFSGKDVLSYDIDVSSLTMDNFFLTTWLYFFEGTMNNDVDYAVASGKLQDNGGWMLYAKKLGSNNKITLTAVLQSAYGTGKSASLSDISEDDILLIQIGWNGENFVLSGITQTSENSSPFSNKDSSVPVIPADVIIGNIPSDEYHPFVGIIDEFLIANSDDFTNLDIQQKLTNKMLTNKKTGVLDEIDPVFDLSFADTVVTTTGQEIEIYGNKSYPVSVTSTDNSGIGYGTYELTDTETGKTFTHYFGPTVAQGSDAPDIANVYTYLYSHYMGNPTTQKSYAVKITMHDIDGNIAEKMITLKVKPAICEIDQNAPGCGGGEGDACKVTNDCSLAFKCAKPDDTICDTLDADDKDDCTCQRWPLITDVEHMSGAAGNFMTIRGYHFGNQNPDTQTNPTSSVKFMYEDGAEVSAELASCNLTDVWRDSWVIVEVPDQPNGKSDADKPSVQITNNLGRSDATNNDFGDKIKDVDDVETGLYTYNDTVRPKLCSVEVANNTDVTLGNGKEYTFLAGGNAATPGVGIKATGESFGNSGLLYFIDGDVDREVSYASWSDEIINSTAPLLDAGSYGVVVESDGIQSNSAVFKIIDPESQSIPVITEIAPAITTKGSYITIFGSGFGYSKGNVKFENGTDSIPAAEIPNYCDSGWSNDQIIVKVPDGLTADKIYTVVVETNDGLTTSKEADDIVEIVDGDPRPSICKLSPKFGSAPLLDEQKLTLLGENFLNLPADEPEIYFWTKNSQPFSDTTPLNKTDWLFTPKAENSNGVEHSDTEIKTIIPVHGTDGYTMVSGPIYVKNDIGVSNPVRYEVIDCREQPSNALGSGMQCCSEGSEAGSWKKGTNLCDGTTRESAYMWRLSSGIIPTPFEVVESCQVGVNPSPTPWQQWEDGDSVCVNALIRAEFTLPVKEDSIILDNGTIDSNAIQIFKCGSDGTINCIDPINNVTNNFKIDVSLQSLEITHATNGENLSPDTWYRVALFRNITSQEQKPKLGNPDNFEQQELKATRPCDTTGDDADDAAYCFDFKTGNSNNICSLVGAFLEPAQHETTLLGIVQDTRYSFITDLEQIFTLDALRPLTYKVYGDAGKCRVIDVDDMGWQWGPDKKNAGYADAAAEAFKYNSTTPGCSTCDNAKYIDRQGYAQAWQNGTQELFAKTNVKAGDENASSKGSVTLDILKDVFGIEGEYVSNDENDYKSKKRQEEKSYFPLSVDLEFTLGDIATSTTDGFDEVIPGQEWEKKSIISRYSDSNNKVVFEIYIIERQTVTEKEREIRISENFTDADSDDALLYYDGITTAPANVPVHIEFNENNMKLFVNENLVDTNDNPSNTQIIESGEYGYLLSAQGSSKMYGKITKLEFEKTVDIEMDDVTIKATSTLNINLGDPRVIDYWPSCIEACINAEIGVMFNQLMKKDTYTTDGITLYKCEDGEQCLNLTQTDIPGLTVGEQKTETIMRAYPDTYLDPATWYKVVINDGSIGGNGPIKAIGAINSDGSIEEGNSAERKEWKFRTKNSNEACLVDTVQVSPDPFYAYFIGQKQTYVSLPKGKPDACNIRGQNLNPWDYGWKWYSADDKIATTTNFSAPAHYNPTCTVNCLPKGSDISRTIFEANAVVSTTLDKAFVPMCGNGYVDAGEDCDIAIDGEVVGVSCTLNCLRSGNTSATSTAIVTDGVYQFQEPGLCGDGIVSPEKGEECDPNNPELFSTSTNKNLKSFCSNTCLWTGSPSTQTGNSHTPVCGSGEVTQGEDCDIAENPQGCSAQCLNLGTRLAQEWCDDSFIGNGTYGEYTDVCRQAVSVCGNGVVENGEECEVGVNGVLEAQCSDRCLLQNVTSTPSHRQCDPDNDEGCNNDGTFAGSSVLYSTPSICGNGVVEDGEYGTANTDGVYGLSCELSNPGIFFDKKQGPVQIVTAVGEPEIGDGDVAFIPVDSRTTTINAEAVSAKVQKASSTASTDEVTVYEESEEALGQNSVTGQGVYNLQCGFEEYSEPVSNTYNNCPQNTNNILGVGGNSCCYTRPQRTAQYPTINADGVCRNTYIEVVFDDKMDYTSFNKNNVAVLQGFADVDGVAYDCTAGGTRNWTTTTISLAYGDDIGFWKSLWNDIKTFFAKLFSGEVFAAVPLTTANDPVVIPAGINTWCQTDVTLTPDVTYTGTLGENGKLDVTASNVALYLDKALEPNAYVLITMNGSPLGVRNTAGVPIMNPVQYNGEGFNRSGDFLGFKTGDKICRLAQIEVDPSAALYTAPQTAKDFVGIVKTNEDQQLITNIPGVYDWEWRWMPSSNPLFEIPTSTEQNIVVTSTLVEGHIDAVGQVEVITDVMEEDNQLGLILSDSFSLTSYFCNNPWPSASTQIPDGTDFSNVVSTTIALHTFEDSEFNYLTRYCADANNPLETYDDLPLFDNIQELTVESVTSTEDILGKYVLFSTSTSDVIGLQIFKNEPNANNKHKSIQEWYMDKFEDLGNMKLTAVDGYEALFNDYSYYINAYNVSSTLPGVIENNVLHFSINEQTQLETQKVFDQLIQNLEFNTNLKEHNACYLDTVASSIPVARNVANSDDISDVVCNTDLDCRDGGGAVLAGTNGYCANQKTKLFRDFARLAQLEAVQVRLDDHFESTKGDATFEGEAKGAYLPGYTNSQWAISWNRLGNAIGGLGTDPVSEWTGCDGADPLTCWKADTAEFICPAFKQVYEYSYYSDTESYKVHAPFEFVMPGDAVYGQFVDDEKVTPEPWCEGTVVAFKAGVCGDGIVNYPQEACDPPHSTAYSTQGYFAESLGICKTNEFNKDCSLDSDCGFTFRATDENRSGSDLHFTNNLGVCMMENKYKIYDASTTAIGNSVVGCSKYGDCKDIQTYDAYPTVKINNEGYNSKDLPFERMNCTKIKDLDSSYTSISCTNFIPEGTIQSCTAPQAATKECTSACQWGYGACTVVPTNCGDGIIQPGEKCDDGVDLNGTYGHCAASGENNACKGPSTAGYCGNNTTEPSHEICDKGTGETTYGTAKNLSCSQTCTDYGPYCGDGIVQSEYDEDCDDGNNIDDDMCPNSCEYPRFCDYPSEEKKCSLDSDCPVSSIKSGSQLYTVNKSKNTKVCVQNSLVPENPPAAAPLKVITKILHSEINQSNNTAQIYGCEDNASCQNIDIYEDNTKSSFGIPDDLSGILSQQKCIPNIDGEVDCFDIPKYQCLDLENAPAYQNTSNVSCKIEYPAAPEETPPEPSTAPTCGDGEINQAKEQCDLGDKNGQQCDPEYNSSCTFCTAECKIGTLESPFQCGNGVVDKDENGKWLEQCDYTLGQSGGQTTVFTTSSSSGAGAVCSDKGSYTCKNTCQTLSNSCLTCGEMSGTGFAEPQIVLLNPLVDGTTDLDIKATLIRPTAPSGVSLMSWYSVREDYVFGSVIGGFANQLVADTQCKEEYQVVFNGASLWGDAFNSSTPLASTTLLITQNKADAFEFPVNGEQKTVKNEYIYSPAVPTESYRVVVKWTKNEADKGGDFRGGFFTSGKNYKFNTISGDTNSINVIFCDIMSQQEILVYTGEMQTSPSSYYTNTDYWWPADPNGSLCSAYVNGIYKHDVRNTENIYIQSYTIETEKLFEENTPYAFIVENPFKTPISNFKYDNITVDVYTYQKGQDPLFSVYKPVKTYEIKGAANTTQSPLAKYWHVFNLMPDSEDTYDISNSGTLSHYKIVPVPRVENIDGQQQMVGFHENGSIETSNTEVLKNIPSSDQSIFDSQNVINYANTNSIPLISSKHIK